MKDHWLQAYKEFYYFGIFLVFLFALVVSLHFFSDVFADQELTFLMFARMVIITAGYIVVGLAFKAKKSSAILGGYILAFLWFLPPFQILPIVVGLYFVVRVFYAQKNKPIQPTTSS